MIALEQFARIRAEIERSGDRDAALSGAAITAKDWIRAQRHWLRELAEEIEKGEIDLASRYCRAFLGTSEAAAPGPVAESAPAPVSAPVDTPSYLASPGAPKIPVVAPTPVLVTPAALPAPPVAAAPPVPFGGTAMVFELPRTPAMPFREGAAAAPPPAATPPRETPKIQSGGTAMVFELPVRPATPFPQDPRPAGAEAAGAPEKAQLASPGFAQGTALDMGLAPAGPSTPFAAPETGPFGLTLPRFAELSAACQEPGASHEKVVASFGLTAPFAEIDAAWKAKLKANAGLILEYHRRLTDEIRALAERRREAAERPKRSGKTVATPIQAPSPAAAAPEPNRAPPAEPNRPPPAEPNRPPPAAAAPVEMTVEQYAWVVATFRKASSPAEVEQTLARFRLTAESKKQLEERWRTRMAAEPALQSRFLELLTGHLRGPAQ